MILKGRWKLLLPRRPVIGGLNVFTKAGAELFANILAGTQATSWTVRFGTSGQEASVSDTNIIGTLAETANLTPTSPENELVLTGSGTFDGSYSLQEWGVRINNVLIARETFPSEGVANLTPYTFEYRLPFQAG